MSAATNGNDWRTRIKTRVAEIVAHFRPQDVSAVHGLTFDGSRVWFVDGGHGRLVSMDTETGAVRIESPPLGADAGTTWDGTHLWAVLGDEIVKLDPATCEIVGRVPAPDGPDCSGLAWSDGALWVGHMRKGRVLKLDAETGEVLKVLESDRFVTGVTWAPGGELWHGSESEDRKSFEVRRLDPESGDVIDCIEMPEGVPCSGLGADEEGRLWCGDPWDGSVRAVRRTAGT